MTFRSAILAVILVFLAGMICQSRAKPRRLPPQIISRVMNEVCLSDCTQEQRISYRRNIKFELHDLNGDKVPEFFVYIQHSDWCGAGFNCSYWVFQRRRKTYRPIAAGYPVLHVTNTVSKGFRDLESHGKLGMCTLPNGSRGWQIWLAILKYKGNEYDAREIGPRCISK